MIETKNLIRHFLKQLPGMAYKERLLSWFPKNVTASVCVLYKSYEGEKQWNIYKIFNERLLLLNNKTLPTN